MQHRLWIWMVVSSPACVGPGDTVLVPDVVDSAGGGSSTKSEGGTTATSVNGTPGSSAAATGGGGAAAATTSAAAGASAGQSAGASGSKPATGRDGGTGGHGGSVAASPEQVDGAGGNGGNGASGAGGDSSGVPNNTALGAQDPDCDFTGVWIGKQVTVSEAIGQAQTTNNWYYLEFTQTGTDIQVSRHFDCGIETLGSATVTTSRATISGLISLNIQTGRKGTLTKDGSQCVLDLEHFWSVRGAAEDRFLPSTRNSTDSLSALATSKPLPTPSMTDGAIDVENDGKLGMAFQVTGIIEGVRNEVQRDWTRWFSEPGFQIAASSDWSTDLKVRTDFEVEDSPIDPTSGLLVSPQQPKVGAKHLMRLHFLGRDASDPRVAAIVKPMAVDTCYAIQDALPGETLE